MLTVVRRHVGFMEKPMDVVRRHECRLPWAWDGLCIAFPFVDKGRNGWREAITGAQPSSITGTVTGGLDTRGQVVISQAGNAGYIDYVDQPRHRAPSTALTVYCRFRYNGSTGANWGIFAKVHTDGTTSTWGLFSPSGATLRGVINTTVAETATNLQDTVALSAGIYSNIVLRWRDNEELRVDVLADGGASLGQPALSTSGLPGSLVYAAAPLRIFGTDTAIGLGGDVSALMVYNRRLCDAEVVALASDPFGWFTPRRETVTVAAPFPVGPGLAAQGIQYVGPTRG